MTTTPQVKEPSYHALLSPTRKIPPKRHTQFRKPDGSLYAEQLFGTIGFDGMYSNIYHEHRPTQVKEILSQKSVAPKMPKPIIFSRIDLRVLMWRLVMII